MSISTSLAVGGPLVMDAGSDYARLEYAPASGVAGATMTLGAWRTVPLDTERIDYEDIVTLSSNQFTLAAGSYRMSFIAGYESENPTINFRLRNITDGTTVTQNPSQNKSLSAQFFDTSFTITSAKTFEIQVFPSATFAFGQTLTTGDFECYATLELFKKKELASTVTIQHGGSGTTEYAEVVKSYAPNAAGQAIAANTLTTLQLDSPTNNNITGLSVTSNQITLLAGTYEIEALTTLTSLSSGQFFSFACLYNVTDASVISSGGASNGGNSVDVIPMVSTQITITSTKVIEFRCMLGTHASNDVYVSRNYTPFAFTDSTAGLDQRTHIRIWKIA